MAPKNSERQKRDTVNTIRILKGKLTSNQIQGHDLFYMSVSMMIIIYFENVAFFRSDLGSDVCPRVDNQTSGDTFQELNPVVELSKGEVGG